MGCDIFWDAKTPDLTRQRVLTSFLISIWEELGWEYDVYDGRPVNGWLNNVGWRGGGTITRPRLLGVSGYIMEKYFLQRLIKDDVMEPTRGQISFVFNNSVGGGKEIENSLLTVAPTCMCAEQTKRTAGNRDCMIGIYKEGGYERSLNETGLIFLLLLIKYAFLPELEADDDGSMFRCMDYKYQMLAGHVPSIDGFGQGDFEVLRPFESEAQSDFISRLASRKGNRQKVIAQARAEVIRELQGQRVIGEVSDGDLIFD